MRTDSAVHQFPHSQFPLLFCYFHHHYVQQYPVLRQFQTLINNQSKFRVRKVDSWYSYTEAFKINSWCTLNVPSLCHCTFFSTTTFRPPENKIKQQKTEQLPSYCQCFAT